MKLELDPEVVKRLAQEREGENWRFRTLLKGMDLDTEELDAIVHRHYEDVARQIDCRACGNCCRDVTPSLSEHDILRLATAQGIDTSEFVQRFVVKDEEGDMLFRDSPCPFQDGNLCGVYDHRPEACRSFPHLHKNEFVFRLVQAVQNCSVCPIVFHVFERLKDELWHNWDDDWAASDDWSNNI
jgi:Fe-S-cluster containining protein